MIATFLTPALALLVTQTVAVAPRPTATVSQWSTYEIVLTAANTRYNLYLNVDLLGVFTGPHGEGVIVNGFWDGGQTFRIRFTPTIEGNWTFSTVSDDPGLDARSGSILCVEAKGGTHGFARQPTGARAAASIHDDGTAVSSETESVAVRAPSGSCGGDGDACGEAVSARTDFIDVAALQAADARVSAASAAGRLIEIRLFEAGDADLFTEPRLYRYTEYMTARFGSFPNVVWCLPAVRDDDATVFWRMARALVAANDPYFKDADGRSRVMRKGCAAPALTSARPAAPRD